MGLDLSQLWPQLEQATKEFVAKDIKGQKSLESASELYREGLWEEGLLEKVKSAKTSWLIPEIVEEPRNFPLPEPVRDYAVVAVDSSHIPPDRHSLSPCFLINLGVAILEYGSSPKAFLESRPKLFYKSQDLVLREPGGLREVPVEGVILGAKRSLEELRFLVENLRHLPPLPSLALWDGSLILWGLTGQTFPRFAIEVLLSQGFVLWLEEIKRAQIPLAGYISFPHSTEVVNLLRLILCPYQVVDCDRHCLGRERDCGVLDGLEDRELFAHLLGEGERSPLFVSRSQVVLEYYRGHEIYFFYLRTPEEVVRVELPCWSIDRINLIHAVIYNQILKGGGYPVVLMEAHEQALLSPSERERFRLLLAESFGGRPSPKRRSKQTPWV